MTQEQQQDVTLPPSWDKDDKVELPVQDFLEFVQSYKQLDFRAMPRPPTNFFVQKLDLDGKTTKEDRVVFDCTYQVLVLVDAWTRCDLLPSDVTVHKYDIQFGETEQDLVKQDATTVAVPQTTTTAIVDDAPAEDKSKQSKQQQPRKKKQDNNKKTTTTTTTQEQPTTPTTPTVPTIPSVVEPVSNNKATTGHIGVVESSHCLITTQKGIYQVTLTISVPYLSKEQKGCALSFPTYSLKNKLRFKVEQDVRIQVEPSLETKVISSTANAIEPSTPSSKNKKASNLLATDEPANSKLTLIESIFPPTDYISIYWTPIVKKEKEDDSKKKKKQEAEKQKEQRPLNVTVEQNTLHSIGGGVISTASQFNYSITNGSINTLYVLITNENDNDDKKVRVLRVEGANIKKWEYKKFKPSTIVGYQSGSDSVSESSFAQMVKNTNSQQAAAAAQQDDKKQRNFIKVILDCGIEGNYNLKVFSEMEMAGQSCQVVVPNFSCILTNREKGYLGIEATSSIEISETAQKQFTKVDVRELPSDLSTRASNPILHGYKFLQTNSTYLKLNVKKHEDVAVLVAVIEEAHFGVTYAEGNFLYHIALKVRNTTQDFIKFVLPEKSSLWSTSVEGKVVRPAQDKQKRVLIPLKRSTSESVFSVEIFFLRPATEMTGTGTQQWEFPTFNTPINHAFYLIHLPNEFKYGEFEGDLRERKEKCFSQTATVFDQVSQDKNKHNAPSNSYNARNAAPRQQMQMQMQQQQQMQYQQQAMPQQMNRNAIFAPQSVMANNMMNSNDSDSEGDDDDEMGGAGLAPQSTTVTNSSSVVGVLPVAVSALTVGQPFYFERLLLREDEKPITLQLEFKEVKKSWWDKRSLFPYKKLVWSMILGFVVLFVLWMANIPILSRFSK